MKWVIPRAAERRQSPEQLYAQSFRQGNAIAPLSNDRRLGAGGRGEFGCFRADIARFSRFVQRLCCESRSHLESRCSRKAAFHVQLDVTLCYSFWPPPVV